ncbi:HlyD family secretion protein [Shewanella violacea]|uniref:HlyD family secretion protein n=1 Tax=Shewanella violacea (strain JCM 10179 / CIP 106290 / LMG 19151 / DSS12) TaxID=637905 RepID=D4ZMD3_SHEVD|nr:HlyD family secretion protein [Shewanella violacea]BAJ02832.1 HlyD family secretion protein [Shewanella violacea DSS12]
MKDKIYKYISYLILTVTVFFSVFLIVSDNIAPFTTQASVHKNVAIIAAEVSGLVTHISVDNGQRVNKGQLLFSIDQTSYRIAVNEAEAELHQAEENDSARWQELAITKQSRLQRQAEKDNFLHKLTRYQSLLKSGLITQEELDDIQLSYSISLSAVVAADAEVLRVSAELAQEKDSAAIELARAKLDQKKRDLVHTNIVSQVDGSVSNLQLEVGTYLSAGDIGLFLVNESHAWINADFNEKGVNYLHTDAEVLLVFDALPGEIFRGNIINQDRAIYDASSVGSKLSDVTNSDRWIREQQKIRTRIYIKELDPKLISGSRATVMVLNGNGIIDSFAMSWMKLISYFRYIY